MADKTVKVTLVAVASPYVSGVTQASTATSKLGTDMDKANTKAGTFTTKMGAAKAVLEGMAVAAGAVAGTALVSFLADSVQAAGDLEQSMGGVEAVFKDSADEIHAFGENSADAVGLSRNEFNELVTVTGALLNNKGIEDFTGKTLMLTERAADLSAVFGTDASEAVEAFNAALRGESEPIERFGISINEAAVNAKVLELGLDGLEGAAAENAKTQARIAIIMEQSADAAGAFAREAGTLQGQQQRLSAEWRDMQAALGEALLPAMTQVVQALRDGIDVALAIGDAFGAVPDEVWAVGAALGAFHLLRTPLGKMNGTMRDMGTALGFARDAARRAGGGFAGVNAGLRTFTGSAGLAATAAGGLRTAGRGLSAFLGGPWGIAFTVGATILANWIGKQREAQQQVQELTDTLDEQTGAVTENTEKRVIQRLEEEGSLAYYESIGGNVEDVTRAILGESDARERVTRLLQDQTEIQYVNGHAMTFQSDEARKLEGQVETLSGQVEESIDSHARQKDALTDTEEELRGNAEAALGLVGRLADAGAETQTYTQDLESLKEQAEAAQEAHMALVQSLLDMIDAAYGAQDAAINYEESVDTLTETIKENGETHDISTEKGRNNQRALIDLAKAAVDAASANLENGDSLFQVQQDMEGARAEFIRGATQMGYTKDEARALADQLGLTDDNVVNLSTSIGNMKDKSVNVEVNGLSAASNALDGVINRIANVRGKTVYINAITNYSSRGQRPVIPGGGPRYMLANGGVIRRAGGGLDQAGNAVPRVSQMGGPAYGKTNILWGEPETGWEAYISGKPGMRQRNLAILSEAANRLGAQVIQKYADGGWSVPASAPSVGSLPSSLAAHVDSVAIGAQVASAVGAEMANYRLEINGREFGRLVRSEMKSGAYV